ncbi:MAG: FAD-dependent oxidoreductase [Pseudomonadales bacterium]|nr:FAD-dependent oxidoreductase [Pseudomonadales bacterium]
MSDSNQSSVLVIVGASHAGSLLAVQARKEGWQGRIVLIGAESHLPYHRPPLSKAVLAGERSLESILLRPELLYSNNQIELRLGERVVSLDRADKCVQLASGEVLHYDKLALCTGATPRRLPVAEGLPGVYTLRQADDVTAIRQLMAAGKRAVVIGGGYIGLEVAAVMTEQGMQVTVAEAAERLLQRVASPTISDYFRLLHESRGVKVMTHASVTEIEREQETLVLTFADGTVLEADLVIVGIGVEPETALAAEAGLEIGNGIVVDGYMGTSDPDIVAAGDCAQFPSARYGRCLRLESVQNALDQARIAAANLCGQRVVYDSLPWFWSDQYDCKLQSAGLRLEHEHEVVRGNPAAVGSEGLSVFYMRGDRMIAADCVNRAKEFMACKRLIAERLPVNLAALADESLLPEHFEQR